MGRTHSITYSEKKPSGQQGQGTGRTREAPDSARQALAPAQAPVQKTTDTWRARFPSLMLCRDHVADMRCLGCQPASGEATLAQVHTRATHPLAANIYHRDSAVAEAAWLLPWAPLVCPGWHSISRFPSEHQLLHGATGPCVSPGLLPSQLPAQRSVWWKEMQTKSPAVVWAGSATPSPSPGQVISRFWHQLPPLRTGNT